MSAISPAIAVEVREACVRAVLDRDMNAADVQRLAESGELESGLDACVPPPARSTIRDWARKERKRRAGLSGAQGSSRLPASERIAQLRARLLNACEHELTRIEREQRKRDAEPVSGERLRQVARALREAASIPEPDGPRRPTPVGQREPETGEHNGSRTRGGLAGGIIADLAAGTAPAPPRSPHDAESVYRHHGDHETGDTDESAAQRSTGEDDGREDESTRDPVREAAEKVAALLPD